MEVETCAWQLDDVSQVESEKRRALEEDMAQRRYKLTSSEMELVFRMVSHRASLSFLIMAGSKAWAGSLQLLPLVFPMNT